jgi:hypothetical protein
MDDNELYQAEMCASDRPPSLSWDCWSSLADALNYYDNLRMSTLMRRDVNASGIEVRLWLYDKNEQRITLIRVDKG